jgi:hypothetical protein
LKKTNSMPKHKSKGAVLQKHDPSKSTKQHSSFWGMAKSFLKEIAPVAAEGLVTALGFPEGGAMVGKFARKLIEHVDPSVKSQVKALFAQVSNLKAHEYNASHISMLSTLRAAHGRARVTTGATRHRTASQKTHKPGWNVSVTNPRGQMSLQSPTRMLGNVGDTPRPGVGDEHFTAPNAVGSLLTYQAPSVSESHSKSQLQSRVVIAQVITPAVEDTAFTTIRIPFNPGMSDFTWLSDRSSGFQRYRVKSLAVEWIPSIQPRDGLVALAPMYRIDQTTPGSMADMMSIPDSAQASAWTGYQVEFDVDAMFPNGHDSYRNIRKESVRDRFEFDCVDIVIAFQGLTGTDILYGEIMLHFDIEVVDPVPDQENTSPSMTNCVMIQGLVESVDSATQCINYTPVGLAFSLNQAQGALSAVLGDKRSIVPFQGLDFRTIRLPRGSYKIIWDLFFSAIVTANTEIILSYETSHEETQGFSTTEVGPLTNGIGVDPIGRGMIFYADAAWKQNRSITVMEELNLTTEMWVRFSLQWVSIFMTSVTTSSRIMIEPMT